MTPSGQRPQAGTPRKGEGPLGGVHRGTPTLLLPQTWPPDPSNPKPTPASLLEEAPESRRWVRACVRPTAALRTPKWRPRAGGAGRMMLGPAPMVPARSAAGRASAGGQRRRRGRRGSGGSRGCRSGLGGTRWVWGRRAHLPLVSAAIAGHMTEAVAGMTVRALATRGGGRPREGGRGSRGADEEEGGRTAPLSPGRVMITVSLGPLLLLPGSPCLSAPKQKWRRRSRLWREGWRHVTEGRR